MVSASAPTANLQAASRARVVGSDPQYRVRQTKNIMWNARAIAAGVLGGLAVLAAALQIAGAISARRQNRSYSLVPFVGAVLGVAACPIAPWKHSAYAIPIFLVLDPTPLFFAYATVTGRLFK